MKCVVNQQEYKGVDKNTGKAVYAVQLFAWMTSDELKKAMTSSGDFEATVLDEVEVVEGQ